MDTNKKIVVIGGGTGTFSVLNGLKRYTSNITAVVTMADSGGSARKERDEWGMLPSSDIRKSLIALADISKKNNLLLRKLFEYRYSEGVGISGMTFGNLFLVALTKLLGSQEKAIKKAGELLQIKGKVLPVTLDKVDLAATYEDGTKIVGEHFIDEPIHNGKLKITKLSTLPKAKAIPEAVKAILESDLIIIGPGGFYTTILANFVVSGLSESVIKSKAKKLYIMNLMTEYGQTYGFSASDFIKELNKYFPIENLDYILVNTSEVPKSILQRYKKQHAQQVKNDLRRKYPFTVISQNFLAKGAVKKQKGDTLRRSFVRHDPEKIAQACFEILNLI